MFQMTPVLEMTSMIIFKALKDFYIKTKKL